MRLGLPSGPLGGHQGSRGTRPGLPGLVGASKSMWGLCLVRRRKALAPVSLLCRPGVALREGGRLGPWHPWCPRPACPGLPRPAFPVCDDLGVKAGDLPLQMEALVPGWVGGQTHDKFYTRATAIHHSVDT